MKRVWVVLAAILLLLDAWGAFLVQLMSDSAVVATNMIVLAVLVIFELAVVTRCLLKKGDSAICAVCALAAVIYASLFYVIANRLYSSDAFLELVPWIDYGYGGKYLVIIAAIAVVAVAVISAVVFLRSGDKGKVDDSTQGPAINWGLDDSAWERVDEPFAARSGEPDRRKWNKGFDKEMVGKGHESKERESSGLQRSGKVTFLLCLAIFLVSLYFAWKDMINGDVSPSEIVFMVMTAGVVAIAITCVLLILWMLFNACIAMAGSLSKSFSTEGERKTDSAILLLSFVLCLIVGYIVYLNRDSFGMENLLERFSGSDFLAMPVAALIILASFVLFLRIVFALLRLGFDHRGVVEMVGEEVAKRLVVWLCETLAGIMNMLEGVPDYLTLLSFDFRDREVERWSQKNQEVNYDDKLDENRRYRDER